MGRPRLERRLYQVLGANVRELRLRRDMQQGILAQRVGITNSAMSRIESGQQALTLPVLFRLSLALHVPYWHIIEGNVATVERAEDV